MTKQPSRGSRNTRELSIADANPCEDRAESGTEASGPIDLSVLDEMVSHDPNLRRRFLRKFIDATPATVRQIQVAYAERSASGIAEATHKLKSTARAIGANALGDLCQSLEKAGQAANWREIDSLEPHLDRLMASVRGHIGQLLSE